MLFNALNNLEIEVKTLDKELYEKEGLPCPATEDSAGYDIRAAVKESLILEPGQSAKIPTGLAIDMKYRNLDFKLIPKSGLGTKNGVVLRNLTGLIDADYQGEISVTLVNTGSEPFEVKRGEWICQATFEICFHPKLKVVDSFSRVTARGTGGHGSTGRK